MAIDYKNIAYYVINLDQSTERWAQLQAECPSDLPLQRLSALDGNAVDPTLLRQIRYLDQLSKPELGCLLSHVHAWEFMLQQGHPAAVILEDDVLFSDNFCSKLQQFQHKLPADFDIAYLGYNPDMHIDFEIPGFGRISAIFEAQQYKLDALQHECYRLFRAWGTCAYIISRQGAQRLIEVITHGMFADGQDIIMSNGFGLIYKNHFPASPIDMRIMSYMDRLNAYVAFPALCKPRPQIKTTITQRASKHD